MSRRNMPVRNLPCFIQMRAKMRYYISLVKGLGEVQVGRRGIDRIGIENHQPIHLAHIQVRDQRPQVSKLIRGRPANLPQRS